jgi:hypothetical protein
LFSFSVHGGGLKYFYKHDSNYKRQKQNFPDEHRSIGPCPIVAAIIGEPHAMRVLYSFGVHGGGLKIFYEYASNNKRQKYNCQDEHRSIGPCPIVATILGEPHTMRVLFSLDVDGGGLQ